MGVDPGITAVSVSQAQTALSSIGARVVTIANQALPRPADAQATADAEFTAHCGGTSNRFFGRIDAPPASETDWFELSGAAAGDVVDVEIFAQRFGSTLDSMVGVYWEGPWQIPG